MFLTLPLTVFGIGLLIYYLFGAATHALPIVAGVMAGFAAAALGVSVPVVVLLAAGVAFITITAGRFASLTARGPFGRGLLIAAFAIPAVMVGGAIGGALANLIGLAGFAIVAAPLAGLTCGLVAANRLVARGA